MTVAELFVRCLAQEGVKYVFGVPGEENEDLLFALAGSPVTFVPTRHEQGAAFIANVWGRLTGEAGVCLSTLGPGATNLLTGVADANLDKAPLVAVTGQGSTTRLHHESHQYIDVVNMFRPVTKWNTSVADARVVPEVVRKAFKLAEIEKPGATHVELPEDVAKETVPAGAVPLPRRGVRRPAPDYKALERAVALLRKARRPLVLAGNGAIRKLASTHLTRFCTTHGIPVVSTFMGKGAVSDRLDVSLLSIGLGFKDYVMEAVEQADLIVTVGYDIAEYAPEAWNPHGDKTIVHIDFVPAEVYTHYTPEVELVSDISGALWALNERLDGDALAAERGWHRAVRRRILDDLATYDLPGDATTFHVPGVLNVVRSILPEDGLLLSDVGAHKMWIARNFPTYCPNGCIISNGLASMGIALPGGIAAALVDPGRPIVAAMGDGGFLMNAQELETARRLNVGFTCLVFNDNDYGLIAWKQEMARGTSVGTRIGNPDFKAFAESFGIPGYRPATVAELRATLEGTLARRELCLVEVPVDTSVNHELVQKLNQYWS
ncbi:acetolactate synthase large subunit [Rhodocaloribacter litoris]|uniref:acetolactate synthase large subunit n=1 Tax=Rhodocaloribacter litoris TaxID=2558931 RepID=UPI0014210DAF|nr:acetolactate synthase large subunit [Rhodocaloribacter litoris]QXD14188.1 acetolactate synthase large subunit [Rhodocaloribacter litoris]GIV59938.1 MAG: acetolactate synthase [Rhodothermaceae bacterium]